jgi:hypothetical protein
MAENQNILNSNKNDILLTREPLQINHEEMDQAIKFAKLYGKCFIDWEVMKEYIKNSLFNVMKNHFESNQGTDVEKTINDSEANKENEIQIFNPAAGEAKSNNFRPLNTLSSLNSFNSAPLPTKFYIKPEPTYDDIVNNLNKMKKCPFTLQRMCELLQDPLKYYKTKSKFLSAFNKLTDVEA